MAGGQTFGIPSAGGRLAVDRLSKKLRALGQPLMRYRQFTTKQADYGKRQGQTLLFDKRLNLDADSSTGAIVAEGSPIPRSGYKVIQGSCTAQTSGQAIPWTEELATFSEFDVDKINREVLVDFMAKALNKRAQLQFEASKICYNPDGAVDSEAAQWGTAGSPGGAADRNIQLFDVKNIVDALKKGVYGTAVSAPVEPYDGANYMAIGSIDYTRALKDDTDWENAARYGDPDRLFSGEVGRIYGTRTVEDNHILGTIGAGAHKGGAYVFGKDPVMEIIAVPEELRVDLPADFGRDNALAFVYIGGFKIIWEYNATTEPDNRIVRVTGS